MTETIDAEIVETSQELVPREAAAAPTLFGTDDPALIVAKAHKVATVLNDVITKQKLYTNISGKRYVLVEGWTTLGALCNVFAKTEWTHQLEDGWEAAVVVVNGNGVEIGRAEAQCLRSERNWKSRDDFALKSMAQTRAMGKALRMPLGWIAVMSGYEATPAEEMPAPAVADDDTPFDQTGGAQDQVPDGMKAHGEHSPGTGAASFTREDALEMRRDALTDRLLELSDLLSKRTVTETAIVKDRLKNEKKPASHLTWLEKQVAAAEIAVDAQTEIPL